MVTTTYCSAPQWGIASSQSPLDSASALRRKLLSLPCSSFSDAIRFAGFASETRVVASLPLNGVQESECGAGYGGRVDAGYGGRVDAGYGGRVDAGG